MSKVNFWMFGLIETKRCSVLLKIEMSLSKVSRRKKSLLLIISYKNVKFHALGRLENVNTFCDNLEQAMAQLGKSYSPSNISNLIVKRSLCFVKIKKYESSKDYLVLQS